MVQAKRFIAVQAGARRNYIIPSILEQNGLLEVLYTDMCGSSGLGAALNRSCPSFLKRGALKRLLNRRVPSNLEGKMCTFDGITLRYLTRQKLAGNNPVKQYRALEIFHEEFSQAMIHKGLGQATHIFCMLSEGWAFTNFAKQQGFTVITDVYISPSTNDIIQKEREKYPELEAIVPPENIQSDHAILKKIFEITDIFIAPSNFVLKGLKEFGVNLEQCHLVPYNIDDSWLTLKNIPVKKRILFVGTAELRKGIHILGMAAQKLKHRGYEFRIAGKVSDTIRNHQLTQNLYFLGQVPRCEIQKEFAQADIFVLPSLAEGSAGVTYEALATGLPIITTEASGSVVQDGIEGFIVPEGDPTALAERIEKLIENRELRDQMALSAKESARNYTWDKCAERLLKVLDM